MKLIMFRGAVPNDRNPKEIVHDRLEDDCDVWTHLACALGDEACEVVFWGGKRDARYSKKDRILWVKDLNHYKPGFTPDVVFARGGFDECDFGAAKFPKALKVYYGAGKRYMPKCRDLYDIVLVDDERQLERVRDAGMNGVLWQKPAAPMFKPLKAEKEYDICYVADGRFPFRARIKNLKWTYKSLPIDLKMLHLGWSGKYKPPKNVTVKRVVRKDMPGEYAKCRCGIVPYSSYDSAPRVLPEMLACGLNVVVLDAVNQCHKNDSVFVTDEHGFWDAVRVASSSTAMPYDGFGACVKHLRGVFGGQR